MLWAFVICLLAFDLTHRFNLVSNDHNSTRHKSIYRRLENSDRCTTTTTRRQSPSVVTTNTPSIIKNSTSISVVTTYTPSIIKNSTTNRTITIERGTVLSVESAHEDFVDFNVNKMEHIGHSLLLTLLNKELVLDLDAIYKIKCLANFHYLTLTNTKPDVSTLPLILKGWKNDNEQKWKLKKSNNNSYHITSLTPSKHPTQNMMVANIIKLIINVNNIGLKSLPIHIIATTINKTKNVCINCENNILSTSCPNKYQWFLENYNHI